MDLLGKKSQLPAAELSDDEMDALSGLTKINPTGKQGSFNPYKTINPEFLTTALDQDDDDWMYMGVSHLKISKMHSFFRKTTNRVNEQDTFSIWLDQAV